jgi:energy-coupling factor transporter ATP-binding protein EcfA2
MPANDAPTQDAATRAHGDNIIVIDNLFKVFGNVTAVCGFSMTVRRGEVVVVVGPSGSGKSTVLRCINHLEVPTEGEIIIEVGMVFQQFNLFPHLTVLENIMLAPMHVRRWPRNGPRSGRATGATGPRRHPGAGRQVPRPALRRPAATRGHRPFAVHGATHPDVRRADQRPRPGDDQGSARRDARPGQRGA